MSASTIALYILLSVLGAYAALVALVLILGFTHRSYMYEGHSKAARKKARRRGKKDE